MGHGAAEREEPSCRQVGDLETLLVDVVRAHLREQFAKALATKGFARDDVAAGREHVEAYVEFVHFAEHVFDAASGPARGHFAEATEEQE